MNRRRERGPTLGNGREPIGGEEDLAYDEDDVPESQGHSMDDPFGRTAQGGFGDEDYDPSYQRENEAADDASITQQGPLRGLPADFEGPGRGQDGSAFATREDEAPDEVDTAGLAAAPTDDSEVRPDDGIEEEIRERLAEEAALDPLDVVVQVRGGVVTLRGTVEDLEARDAAGECAALVAGVRRVDNALTVRDAADPAAPD
jgi:hypothetical protein